MVEGHSFGHKKLNSGEQWNRLSYECETNLEGY